MDTDNQTGPYRCEQCPRMGDLDCNGRIDNKDLLILAEDWLHSRDHF